MSRGRPNTAGRCGVAGPSGRTGRPAASDSLNDEPIGIHCVGIGGCGLSGLARLMAARGAAVSGSDSVPSDLTRQLAGEGIDVAVGGAPGVPERASLVIASAAIKPDHPEIDAAMQRQIPVLSYAEALGLIQAEHTGVSVAGTHGKSTTAAILAHVLIQAGLDPNVIVGATCPQIGGGCRLGAPVVPGDGPYARRPGFLIAEACEFNRSFHHHRPVIGLVNNVEEDHLDVYGTIDAIVEAFAGFARLLPAASEGGRLLIAHDGAYRQRVTEGLSAAVETFGPSPDADYQVRYDPGSRRVTLGRKGKTLAAWDNPMPGEHNAHNAAAAAILASYFGVEWTAAADALGSFAGLDRRMQRLGERRLTGGGRVVVYDDYGHHPTEIAQTLGALRAAEKPARLICVFQPHQHSRTRFLLARFAESFEAADVVIVPHIYFVRDSEIEKQRVSAADLVDRLRGRGITAMHVYPFGAIVEQLEIICRDGDLLVVMGAGPVWQVARAFLARQQSGETLSHPHLAASAP